MKVTCLNCSKNDHKFVFVSGLDFKNNLTTNWKITILEYSDKWLAFGMCQKEKIKKNEYKFSASWPPYDHGNYMLTSKGYTFNCSVKEENNIHYGNIPKIKKGTVINFSFDNNNLESGILTISIGSQFSVKLSGIKGEDLSPHVIFMQQGDSVKFDFN
jgi:hypothetical protein